MKRRKEMSDEMTAVQGIEAFLEGWQGDNQPMRDWFKLFYKEMASLPEVSLTFVARPGVSYSMRPRHARQTKRDKFAIIDIIDDDPSERWLSVCFYEDMITDPQEKGELIPGGLSGSDGYCFDMYENDEETAKYILDRLHEAGRTAAAY